MKSKIAFVLLIVSIVFIKNAIRCSSSNVDPNYYIVASDTMFMPKGDEIVYHKHYVLDYNEEAEVANWVAYYLTSDELIKKVDRTNNFRPDPLVPTESARLIDYKYSGYDRGHLAPAGDFVFSYEAMSESFYLSNMIPQDPGLNRGKWKNLENYARGIAKQKKGLYIITGPVLKGSTKTIGIDSVVVPTYVYKILYSPNDMTVMAFLMPNEKVYGDLIEYVVTVDKLEHITGIDFLYQLNDTLETFIESDIEYDGWF